MNLGPRGTRATIGAPGTGISYTTKLSHKSPHPKPPPKKIVYCPRCEYQGKRKRKVKGSFIVELGLWLLILPALLLLPVAGLVLIVALIYSIWRMMTAHYVCPECGEAAVMPLRVYQKRLAAKQ